MVLVDEVRLFFYRQVDFLERQVKRALQALVARHELLFRQTAQRFVDHGVLDQAVFVVQTYESERGTFSHVTQHNAIATRAHAP